MITGKLAVKLVIEVLIGSSEAIIQETIDSLQKQEEEGRLVEEDRKLVKNYLAELAG